KEKFTEDGVEGVPGDLILCGVADEAVGISESDVRGGGPVALIIGDDMDSVVLPYSDAGVGGAEVDSDGGTVVSFSGGGHGNVSEEVKRKE
ncbi:hypothetical protein L195_g022316, partial [Trifolium pratense]